MQFDRLKRRQFITVARSGDRYSLCYSDLMPAARITGVHFSV
jgi:hypothetical protein